MPNPTNNKRVDSKTIAALFDMTPRRVQQLTKDGVIAAVKEGNANRFPDDSPRRRKARPGPRPATGRP